MIECRLPISPTPSFINRVRLIGTSLRRWYPDTMMTVCSYPSPEPPLPNPGDIEWWSVPTEAEAALWAGTRAPYMATIADTWREPFTGSHILHLDADVLPIARFDELLTIDALCGVPAHHSPCSNYQWFAMFNRYGLAAPPHDMPYSGFLAMFGLGQRFFGPRGYFNSGMVFGPRHLFERLAPAFADAVTFLRATLADVYWIDQLAFVLAVHAANIPTHTLPLRYNFPNRPAFDRANPEELGDVRFLHAMQTDVVDRDRDFASDEAMAALVARTDLVGSNEVLRRWLAEL